MGAGASTVKQDIQKASVDELKAVAQTLSTEDREKVKVALEKTKTGSHVISNVDGKDGGQQLLVIACSPMQGNSGSNNIGKAFCSAYAAKFPNDSIEVLDLSNPQAMPPFTATRAKAKFTTYGGADAADDVAEWAATKKLIEQFKKADKYLFLCPMWNLFIPYTLKLYLDHIVQPHQTFAADMSGGLVKGKPACVISASGGVPVGGEMDAGFDYLSAVLGFIGFTDIRLVPVSGIADPSVRDKVFAEAGAKAAEIAEKFNFDENAKPESKFKAPEIAEPTAAAIKEGAKVLYITASPMGEHSATNTATSKFIEAIKEKAKVEVTTLDLAKDEPAAFTAASVQGKFATWAGGKDAKLEDAVAKEWAVSKGFINQLQAADVVIFGVPMWNLTIPYNLKLWIDHVVQPHETFDAATQKGLLSGKRAFVVAASGGVPFGSPYDKLRPYMKMILGFIGIEDVSFVAVKNKDAADEAVSKLKELASV